MGLVGSYAAEYARDNRDEILKWCEDHFGPEGLIDHRWAALEFTIQFRDKKDRDWYILRWM